MFEFIRSNSDGGNFQIPVMKKPTSGETFKRGELLKMENGTVTKAAGTDVPVFICGNDYVAPAADAKEILCYHINPLHEYVTTFSADGSTVVEGSKVTVSDDGLQVTATATGGIVTIVKKIESGTAGTAVVVKF